MKKHSFFIAALLPFLSHAIYDNSEVDVAFAKAFYMEMKSRSEIILGYKDDLDFEHPIISRVIDGNGRLFHFVGFLHASDVSSGYYVVFEICENDESKYRMSFSGYSPNIGKEMLDFRSAENDKSADFPGDCASEDD